MLWVKRKLLYALVALTFLPAVLNTLGASTVFAADATWIDASTIQLGDQIFVDSSLDNTYSYKYHHESCDDEIDLHVNNDGLPNVAQGILTRYSYNPIAKGCVKDQPVQVNFDTATLSNSGIQYYWVDPQTISTSDHKTFNKFNGAGDFNGLYFRAGDSCPDAIRVNDDHKTGTFTEYHTPGGFGEQNGCRQGASNNITIYKPEDGPNGDPAHDAAGGSGGSVKDKCQISGGLGWILCPIISIITQGISFLESRVLNFLQAVPLASSDSSGNATNIYRAWEIIRNLANVFFVIIFFAILGGNALGIDAYTVKKVLPRLVLAVILVQFSFVFMAVAIDATNVVGQGIGGLLAPLSSLQGVSSGNSGTVHFFGGLEAAAGAAVGGTALVLLGLAIPLLLLLASALISILAVFVTLEARIMVLNLLILTSPIALAAWVLPNTNKLFKTWSTNLVKLLLMYPMIVILIYGGKIVSDLPGISTADDPIQKIMSSLGPIIFFFLVLKTLKASGTIMGAVSGAIQGRASKMSKGLSSGKPMKNSMESSRRKSGLLMDKENGRVKRAFGAIGSGNALSFGKAGRYKKATAYSFAVSEEGKFIEEDLKRKGIASDNKELKKFYKNSKSQVERITALRMLGDNGGAEELGQIYEEDMYGKYGTTDMSKWKGPNAERDKDLWTRGTANSRSELAKVIPYSVRPDGEDSLTKMNAEQFASMKGFAGDNIDLRDATGAVVKDSSGATIKTTHLENALRSGKADKQRVLTTMVNIGQSTDRRGRVDRKNVLAFKRAVDSGLIDDSFKVNVGGHDFTAREFVRDYIKDTGELMAVPETGGAAPSSLIPPPPPPPPPVTSTGAGGATAGGGAGGAAGGAGGGAGSA